ncbi:MAG: NTPase [bacterium]
MKKSKIKNILITGNPGVGKTTLIKNIISKLNISAGGFYTSEIRNSEGKRWGFKIISLDGKEDIMASVQIISRYRISKYGVNITAIDRIGTSAIADAIKNKDIIIIDEIGRMELFSKEFANVTIDALDSPKIVLGTITAKNTNFTKKIKERTDTKIVKLNRVNFAEIETYIERQIRSIYE